MAGGGRKSAMYQTDGLGWGFGRKTTSFMGSYLAAGVSCKPRFSSFLLALPRNRPSSRHQGWMRWCFT
jgi:hypothetical protein